MRGSRPARRRPTAIHADRTAQLTRCWLAQATEAGPFEHDLQNMAKGLRRLAQHPAKANRANESNEGYERESKGHG
jgi:hypothetical protein